jgi:uncharacterized protein (DUF58 family)
MVREYQPEGGARIGVLVDDDAAGAARHFEAALSLAAGAVDYALRSEAPVGWLVVGREAHPLPGERGSRALDEALDLLAPAQRSTAFGADAVLARLDPILDELSSMLMILLRWDEERARLAQAIRVRGVRCVVAVVGDHAAREPHGVTLEAEAIAAGKKVAL